MPKLSDLIPERELSRGPLMLRRGLLGKKPVIATNYWLLREDRTPPELLQLFQTRVEQFPHAVIPLSAQAAQQLREKSRASLAAPLDEYLEPTEEVVEPMGFQLRRWTTPGAEVWLRIHGDWFRENGFLITPAPDPTKNPCVLHTLEGPAGLIQGYGRQLAVPNPLPGRRTS